MTAEFETMMKALNCLYLDAPKPVADDVRAKVTAYIEKVVHLKDWPELDTEDQPLPEDEAIRVAFPTRSGRHEEYAEAMRLVGARRSKRGLVALVHWLLVRIADLGLSYQETVKVGQGLLGERDVLRREIEYARVTVEQQKETFAQSLGLPRECFVTGAAERVKRERDQAMAALANPRCHEGLDEWCPACGNYIERHTDSRVLVCQPDCIGAQARREASRGAAT